MKKKENYFFAESFDELVDSPIIISERLQHGSYKVNGVKFNVWFHGECKPPWKKILKDFKRFTQEQLNVFNEFPFTEYHFLYQILPFKAYHGVEHQKVLLFVWGLVILFSMTRTMKNFRCFVSRIISCMECKINPTS